MKYMRRTKIVATLGPATDDPATLDGILAAGVDVVRLNFSHGSADDQRRRARMIRERAQASGRHVGILADLQGPKIRIERFANGAVELVEGAPFTLDAALDTHAGTQEQVGVTYKPLADDVAVGDRLLLDDGRIVLHVDGIEGSRVRCHVVVGGRLSNNKGINREGGGLTAPAITDKDRADIVTIAEIAADYVAVSFPRRAADLEEARSLLQAAGHDAPLVAKIERAEAVDAIDEILEAADAVMVARGDLGVEIGDAALPAVQKTIIRKAREHDRVVITATQMMESMITNPIPTRAEVLDVANAVLDGTDAVMLSGETAVGDYPVKVVEAMHRVCVGAERQTRNAMDHRVDSRFTRVDEAIAIAAMYTGNHLGVEAIVALTESGSTPHWMSRISSEIPIFALTRHPRTIHRVTLYRGVYPVYFNATEQAPRGDHASVNKAAVDQIKRICALDDHSVIIITKGDLRGVRGHTNTMKIVHVADILNAAM